MLGVVTEYFRPVTAAVLLVVSFSFLSACSAETEEFNCHSPTSTNCQLKPGKRFWSFHLGMQKADAFERACSGPGSQHLANPRFSAGLAPPASNRFFKTTGPVKCEYRSQARQLDYWSFDSNSGLCWGPRQENLSMDFSGDKLVRLTIGCGSIDF